MKTYVTVHDSSIIERCEEEGRFSALDYVYLFVGPRSVDVPEGVEVIRCLDFQPNYEHLPHFYDFTGWFVLARHGLIESEKVIFVQYDHLVTDKTVESQTSLLLDVYPMIGYVPAARELWTLDLPNFYKNQVSGITQCGDDWLTLEREHPFGMWPSTQGTAWRTEKFVEFMMWFEPAFEAFRNDPYAGHLAERMIQPFLMKNSLEAGFLTDVVFHESLDCHGTRDLAFGNLHSFNNKQLMFGR